MYGSDSKTPQCKTMVELDPSLVQLMNVDFPNTFCAGNIIHSCGVHITLVDTELRALIIEYI